MFLIILRFLMNWINSWVEYLYDSGVIEKDEIEKVKEKLDACCYAYYYGDYYGGE